jgi:hypothetical protein
LCDGIIELCVCTRSVLSVGWPLGVIRLLSRPLQNVSKGSLVDNSSGSGLFWGQQASFSSFLPFLRFFRFLGYVSIQGYLIIRVFSVSIHKGVMFCRIYIYIYHEAYSDWQSQ